MSAQQGVVNHAEAEAFAYMHSDTSNLARCYLELMERSEREGVPAGDGTREGRLLSTPRRNQQMPGAPSGNVVAAKADETLAEHCVIELMRECRHRLKEFTARAPTICAQAQAGLDHYIDLRDGKPAASAQPKQERE